MFDRLTREVSVSFVWKLDIADDPAVAFDGLVHALTLDREGAGIIVSHAVDQQNGVLDLVRLHEGRDFDVHLRGFPDGATFTLETERRKRAIVSATASDSCPE